jgi:hypothetical protein
LAATLTITDFKCNLFALLHILLACTLQDRGMQEDILATIFRGHEAEAAHLVEPLHRASDVIGRPAFVAIEFAARRRTIPEITARRTITKATATTAETTAATEAAAAEITTRGTIAKVTTRGTITKATATTTEATAAAEITARGTITKVTARGTITKTATTKFPTRGPRFAATFALLQLHDPRNQSPPLAIRPDFTNKLIAGIRRFNARFGQCRCVKEHILPIRTQYKAEAFTGIVPFHLGLDRPGVTLVFVFRKHVLTIHTY